MAQALRDIGLSSDPDDDPGGPTGSLTRADRARHPSGSQLLWPARSMTPESATNTLVETSRARAERGDSPGRDIELPPDKPKTLAKKKALNGKRSMQGNR